jgi:hypothetical protein
VRDLGHRLRGEAGGVNCVKLHELIHIEVSLLVLSISRRGSVHRQVDSVLRVHLVEAGSVFRHSTGPIVHGIEVG